MNPILEQIRESEQDISCFPILSDFKTPHFHSNLELHYAHGYDFEILINGVNVKLKKGELILVNSFDIHSTKGVGTTCVIIPKHFLTDIDAYIKTHPLNQNVFYDKNGKLLDIINKFKDPSLHYLAKKAIIYELFYELYSLYEPSDNTYAITQGTNSAIIKNFILYVDKNYKKKLNLNTVADDLNYSKSHLSHSLKKYLNCNFNSYLSLIRLNKFIERIKENPNQELISLAFSCGFDSLQTFYRHFKEVFNDSPSAYVKKLKK